MNYKKSMKLVVLLISSILIATVSATIYDYMNLNGAVGVQGMSLAWLLGADNSTAGTQINGVTATLANLKGPPNGTRVYTEIGRAHV
jgi:4-hydroxybenzoate polyprenyltransferase